MGPKADQQLRKRDLERTKSSKMGLEKCRTPRKNTSNTF